MRTLATAALAVSLSLVSIPGAAEPVRVSLADYAFDFPTYGYEIAVAGETKNYTDNLTADDHITITADGYKLRTLIDRMGRRDRQEFIRFFNENCIIIVGDGCAIEAEGDIELDENMRMIFRMSTATIGKGGAQWSNAE